MTKPRFLEAAMDSLRFTEHGGSERGQNCSVPRSTLSETLQAVSKQNMNRLTNSGLLLDDICHLEESARAEKLLLIRSPEYGYNLVFWFTSSCQPKKKTGSNHSRATSTSY
jgi:hypothetical protein